ncbi:MAG TPA: ComEC/Rec2 family competence protein [Spirochaetota bacterium]|nr:ComEC/Rec2 family competence protein [Spirochaetota bacterium]HPC42461.1 ComEC/Rec2 family competence protein [Spirochaetota bacterium]HQF08088.1 ComEC/Rec2 family competence protein [Spirochaetota bacterium]HQH97025.1 ComEC/Rec2 family competence protein [Spirochaetota bacterium]HQJ70207.1 ComEC/Rec2 family competence protein [Spirochaetota bacterium]
MKSKFSFSASLRELCSMCAKNSFCKKIFVPSFFICLVLGGTILIAASFYLDDRISPTGVALLAMSCAVFSPVYRNAIRFKDRPGRSFAAGNAVRAVTVLLVAGGLSAACFARMGEMLAGSGGDLRRGRWTAQVESVVEKRYYREAEICFRVMQDDGPVRKASPAVYRGLARIAGGNIGRGDTIRFLAGPVNIKARAANSSPSNRSLLMRGIHHVFYLDGRSVEVVKAEASFRDRAREALAANCDRLFNRGTSAMAKALYFGNQDYIAKTTMNDFKRAGVFHILSAGGLHVGVIAAVPLFLLGIVRVNRRIIMAVSVMAVFLYLCMTDAPVCLLRSCIMFFMYAVQRIAGREANVFNTLFLSGVVILMIYPHELFGLGFQLSYGATLGILLFHGAYRRSLSRLPGFISSPAAMTLSAQLLVLPVLMTRLNELNLAGLLSNIVVVPLMSLFLVASLAAHALSAIAAAPGLWAGRAVNAVYGLNEAVVESLSGLDGHFYVEAVGPALAAAFCLLTAPLLPRLRSYRLVSLSVAAAAAIAWLSLGAGVRSESVTCVRHGAGALLLVKKGGLLSIAGQAPDRGACGELMRLIALSSPRDIEIHITDPDCRNITGFTVLLKRLPVRRCYLSGSFRIRGYSRRFLDVLERDRVQLVIHEGHAGEDPDDICDLYRRVAAGIVPPSDAAHSKKIGMQYLTLH